VWRLLAVVMYTATAAYTMLPAQTQQQAAMMPSCHVTLQFTAGQVARSACPASALLGQALCMLSNCCQHEHMHSN
jgi:hypothetical protein